MNANLFWLARPTFCSPNLCVVHLLYSTLERQFTLEPSERATVIGVRTRGMTGRLNGTFDLYLAPISPHGDGWLNLIDENDKVGMRSKMSNNPGPVSNPWPIHLHWCKLYRSSKGLPLYDAMLFCPVQTPALPVRALQTALFLLWPGLPCPILHCVHLFCSLWAAPWPRSKYYNESWSSEFEWCTYLAIL